MPCWNFKLMLSNGIQAQWKLKRKETCKCCDDTLLLGSDLFNIIESLKVVLFPQVAEIPSSNMVFRKILVLIAAVQVNRVMIMYLLRVNSPLCMCNLLCKIWFYSKSLFPVPLLGIICFVNLAEVSYLYCPGGCLFE
jgi:hypothetical protein